LYFFIRLLLTPHKKDKQTKAFEIESSILTHNQVQRVQAKAGFGESFLKGRVKSEDGKGKMRGFSNPFEKTEV